jgi:hypothetical protein
MASLRYSIESEFSRASDKAVRERDLVGTFRSIAIDVSTNARLLYFESSLTLRNTD